MGRRIKKNVAILLWKTNKRIAEFQLGNSVAQKSIQLEVEFTIGKKMATGTFTHNSMRKKTLIKNANKRFKKFKHSMNNVDSAFKNFASLVSSI